MVKKYGKNVAYAFNFYSHLTQHFYLPLGTLWAIIFILPYIPEDALPYLTGRDVPLERVFFGGKNYATGCLFF